MTSSFLGTLLASKWGARRRVKLNFRSLIAFHRAPRLVFGVANILQGAVHALGRSIGIAVVYSVVSGLFEAMGNISQSPPVLAAWSPDVIFALVGGYLILKVPT